MKKTIGASPVMNPQAITYNERSWAIDLIGHVKQIAASSNHSIMDAGGEQTVRAEGGMLFPDVLLFGDRATARILQGWELKMPDTSIDDQEFRQNAERKARILGLDSFLLWNVSYARLYIKDAATNIFYLNKQWDQLSFVSTRASVVPNQAAWKALATEIVNYLNDLFDRNTLEGRQFIDAYKTGGITSLILENTNTVANALRQAAKRDVRLNAEITLWWHQNQLEYQGKDRWNVLAQANLSNWIGKFLFAHILQGLDNRAQAVTQINDESTPLNALAIFEQLSQQCNFWTIFSPITGLSILSERCWGQLKQFHKLLTDIRIGSIDQEQLSGILEATSEAAVRKLRGQYPTPLPLARLLIHLCVRNVEEDRVLDPCCGSGTIARAALEQKIQNEVTPKAATDAVFAGDQDAQAIQIATLAMAKPFLMHMPLRLFCKDAFQLSPDTTLEFRNPSTGKVFTEQIGRFQAITSNLPFVAQEGRPQYSKAIAAINSLFSNQMVPLSGRADISAYLPFAFHPLLEKEGRLGIIITNSWLGTDWGNQFVDLIRHYYKLKSVVTSGAGRWFQNSKVVTNILILEKRELVETEGTTEDNETVDFVVLTRPVTELASQEDVSVAAAQIELGQAQNESMTIRSVSRRNLMRFRVFGLGGNAQFVDCDWVLDLPLTPLRSFFNISRGERKGWDKMFYPAAGHGIESDYIQPVLKSSKEVTGYVAAARSDAFSCSRSLEELRQLDHSGALRWIESFQDALNKKGKPLTKELSKSGKLWYEMRTDTLAELVMPFNYNTRLFVARLDVPSFVNQRLTRLNTKPNADVELCHALLNSVISMFLIEGMGFGRGEGVLDMNPSQIKKFMHILDPAKLSPQGVEAIKKAFKPLLQRNVLQVADELEQDDRRNFDAVVLTAFHLTVPQSRIYENLLSLVSIRQSARVRFT